MELHTWRKMMVVVEKRAQVTSEFEQHKARIVTKATKQILESRWLQRNTLKLEFEGNCLVIRGTSPSHYNMILANTCVSNLMTGGLSYQSLIEVVDPAVKTLQ